MNRRQAAWLTLGAAALVAAVHLLPGGARLAPTDFLVGGPDALEFCDPANPRFIPVVRRASPISFTLRIAAPARTGEVCAVTLDLRTSTGKPVGPRELVLLAGAKLRIFLVDPALEDFQLAAADPDSAPGEWRFSFTPRREGDYRLFADIEPSATGRELYASADLKVDRGAPVPAPKASRSPISISPSPVYARRPVSVSIPGDRAHLVAIDKGRTGLLSLAASPKGDFAFTFEDPGSYVLWSWDDLSGRSSGSGLPVDVLP